MRSIVIGLLGLFVLLSCQSNKKPKPNPNMPPKYAVSVEPKFKHQGNLEFLTRKGNEISAIKVEVADNNAKREQGMMHRKTMGADEGMLFIFPDEKRRSFWMKNTHLALDIIFVNSNKDIVYIAENCQPYSTQSIPSYEYAQFVVEVTAGYCSQNNIRVGNSIDFTLLTKYN